MNEEFVEDEIFDENEGEVYELLPEEEETSGGAGSYVYITTSASFVSYRATLVGSVQWLTNTIGARVTKNSSAFKVTKGAGRTGIVRFYATVKFPDGSQNRPRFQITFK